MLIAFVGSVFSPYYAAARRRLGDALVPADAHCAINVSLHRRRGPRWQRWWAMTERGAAARGDAHLRIGRSELAWSTEGELLVRLHERCSPWPRRLSGQLHLRPAALPGQAFALDAAAAHWWQPVAPQARLQADFDAPACRWRGDAYLDANWGARPLERDFSAWQWQRGLQADGSTCIRYAADGRDGTQRRLALRLQPNGQLVHETADAIQPLPTSRWGLRRDGLHGHTPRLLTLEDGPFYCRSLLEDGSGGMAMHESLDLRRFERRWVQTLLPFRMPRWAGAAP